MERAKQIAALRRELRSAFPSSHGLISPGRDLHGLQAGLPTGLEPLDRILVGQGLPRGRITELMGGTTSGKTALAHRMVARTTRDISAVAWIDLAHAFFPPSAAAAGTHLERLLLVRPKTMGEALKAAEIAVKGGAFPLVVLDWAGESWKGANGVDLSTALARLNGLCSLGRTALVIITTPQSSVDPLRYYATLRIEARWEGRTGGRGAYETVEDGQPPRMAGITAPRPNGALVFQIIKYKLGAPGRRIEVALEGRETARLPLHSGIPDPGPPP